MVVHVIGGRDQRAQQPAGGQRGHRAVGHDVAQVGALGPVGHHQAQHALAGHHLVRAEHVQHPGQRRVFGPAAPRPGGHHPRAVHGGGVIGVADEEGQGDIAPQAGVPGSPELQPRPVVGAIRIDQPVTAVVEELARFQHRGSVLRSSSSVGRGGGQGWRAGLAQHAAFRLPVSLVRV